MYPFMSAQDIGNILYQTVWPYVRWSSEIPGLGVAPEIESQLEKTKCRARLEAIVQNRIQELKAAPGWQQALSELRNELVSSN